MSPRSYTAEDYERIRYGYIHLEKLSVIAAALGRSEICIRKKAKRMGLSCEARQARFNRELLRQRMEDPDFKNTVHSASRTPEARARRSEAMKARWQQPGFRELALHRHKKHFDQQRGFAVPPAKKAEYDYLVQRKKLTPREAGEVLGLLPKHLKQGAR